MTTLTETIHAGAFVVSEAEGFLSRDQITIAISQTLVAGQVLGRTAVPASVTSSVAADASNTGNGVFTIDGTVPVGANAQNGVYRVVNALVAANGGEFVVFGPNGAEIGRVAVGATFNNQIKFAIADGATDFAIGDAFSVTVGIEPGDFQYGALNLSATDGTQNAAAVLYDAVTTGGSATLPAAAITRVAEVRGVDLTWPAGITAVQQAAATAQLAGARIIVR